MRLAKQNTPTAGRFPEFGSKAPSWMLIHSIYVSVFSNFESENTSYPISPLSRMLFGNTDITLTHDLLAELDLFQNSLWLP